jgi:hypothetical protein
VLAVDADRRVGERRGDRRLERREVAGVHDRGLQLPEQPQQRRVDLEPVAVALADRVKAHLVPRDALPKRRDLGQRDHGVPEIGGRHSVDQVHDAVLEAADVESVDDVGDERPRISRVVPRRHRHCPRASFRRASIAGAMSETKAASVAAACVSRASDIGV